MKQSTKTSFLVAGALISLSGIGYLLTQEFLSTVGLFGVEIHFSQAWWQASHVLIGMGFLITVGMLTSEHLRPKLLSGNKRRKKSGLSLIALISLSCLSGYLLMLVSSEKLSEVIGLVHWITGLGGALMLILHLKLPK